MAHRFGSRARGRGDVRRLQEPAPGVHLRPFGGLRIGLQRRAEDRGLAIVKRQDLRHGDLPALARRLHPARRGAVEPCTFGARQGAVRHLLDEDVPKREPASAGRSDQVTVGEVLAKQARLRRQSALERGDSGRPKRTAEHAAELQDSPLQGRQQVEPGQHGRLHRVR